MSNSASNATRDNRQRKFWGWGFADDVVSDKEILELGDHLHASFGITPQDLSPAPRLEEIELRDPRVAPPASLERICSADRWARVEHTLGKNYDDFARGLYGQYKNPPDFVAFPETENDVAAVLDWATNNNVAVIPYGGGSSVARGIEPDIPDSYAGAVSLDLRHLNQVLEIDHTSRSALIQAGVRGPDLEAQLKPQGLSMRFYLQAFEFSTLGGWIATRAAGHFATMFTQIDDQVAGLRTLTPAGVSESRRIPCDGAGVDPNRLMIGSEGTFGVITEAWMRLLERPTFKSNASVLFADFDKGVEAARLIAQSGLWPANCRLLDPTESRLAGASDGSQSVLILGFESAHEETESALASAVAIALAAGGTVQGQESARAGEVVGRGGAAGKWRNFFVRGPYYKEGYARMGILRETFETACSWTDFPELYASVVDATTKAIRKVSGAGSVACRFTHVYPDGPAPYFTVLTSARKGSELEQWAEIKQAASDAVLAAGGTITHHHSVGRYHRPWYDQQMPALHRAALGGIKSALDPAGIMNPGVLIDP
ncbi:MULTISPECIES: FAD-binding oxidoreductase [unclassified Pseudonocardia]|uniref:FAD-binding oxidoreductase n=1 Tax=unclassified Pseudonocardia TaxID=2619320 RepID=UPI000BFCD48B|nr:FAD-binding oxidoreductase [Pseudonocardia sp. N23]GAY11006.1 possible alkyldihydroxyacetonephosphate synthase AGPS [Pseudonocardia sp. N23]GJF01579.1 alkyldihydroxyacetonephosphate synthase [Pseudonocardia sp. D17]